jgi:hypothetical protein
MVTKLGEFSRNGRLLILGSFLKASKEAHIFYATLYSYYRYIAIMHYFLKNRLG